VEQWGVQETTLRGPTNGNPFVDVELAARFIQGTNTVNVPGFYDGDGTYRIRFMPDRQGEWRYQTKSNRRALNHKHGKFMVTAPSLGNHGPVYATNTYHFAYADGTPYKQLGTTCYQWAHQTEAVQEQTLQTPAASPFNKLRMCVFNKRYSDSPNTTFWSTRTRPIGNASGRRCRAPIRSIA
jgi:hypothetical protein